MADQCQGSREDVGGGAEGQAEEVGVEAWEGAHGGAEMGGRGKDHADRKEKCKGSLPSRTTEVSPALLAVL